MKNSLLKQGTDRYSSWLNFPTRQSSLDVGGYVCCEGPILLNLESGDMPVQGPGHYRASGAAGGER
jgi:hypothetical protein